MTEKERWDLAAVDYQAVFHLGLSDYNRSLLTFWAENGMLFPGARVLDIGCGVGKYGTYLAELGCDVTLTDISSEMLRHAQENMSKYGSPWTIHCGDFNEVTGEEAVFAGGFDLAISTMSPAIHDVSTVRKMSAMTHGWCFLARFYAWRQPFRDRLMQQMGIMPIHLFDDLRSDCASMIRAVSKAGYVPQVKYVDYNWCDERTPEQMADYMRRNYFAEKENVEELCKEVLRLSSLLSNINGYVSDAVNTKVAWIYWKTQE